MCAASLGLLKVTPENVVYIAVGQGAIYTSTSKKTKTNKKKTHAKIYSRSIRGLFCKGDSGMQHEYIMEESHSNHIQRLGVADLFGVLM